jgi:hypothetical protein
MWATVCEDYSGLYWFSRSQIKHSALRKAATRPQLLSFSVKATRKPL